MRGSTASTVYPVIEEPPLEAGGENVVTPEGLAATLRGAVGTVCRGKEKEQERAVGRPKSEELTQWAACNTAQLCGKGAGDVPRQVHWAGPRDTPAMHFIAPVLLL